MKAKESATISLSEPCNNEWFQGLTDETKALFTGTTANYNHLTFWEAIPQSDKKMMYRYWQVRTGQQEMQEDDLHSLSMEVICELADRSLEREFGISREEMCDADGSLYEVYQDRFNDLYDELEDRLLNHDFVTK